MHLDNTMKFHKILFLLAVCALLPCGGVAQGSPIQVATMAELQSMSLMLFKPNDEVRVYGKDRIGDGGGGIFVYSELGTEPVDNAMVVATSTGMGRWVRKPGKGPIMVDWFGPEKDGSRDVSGKIRAAFAAAQKLRLEVSFGSGTYLIDSAEPIPLHSGLKVEAYGATFVFPQRDFIGERRMFSGESITDFRWEGGTFKGMRSSWAVATTAIGIEIKGPGIARVTLHRMRFEDINGPGIHIHGTKTSYAQDVMIDRVTLERCGLPMYDWQSEEYQRTRSLYPPGVRWDLIGMLRIESFSKLTIKNSSFLSSFGESMDLNGGAGLRFINNQIINSGFGGIFFRYVHRVTVEDSTVENSSSRGFTSEGDCWDVTVRNLRINRSGRESIRLKGNQRNFQFMNCEIGGAGWRRDPGRDAEIRLIDKVEDVRFEGLRMAPAAEPAHAIILEGQVRGVYFERVASTRSVRILCTPDSIPKVGSFPDAKQVIVTSEELAALVASNY
jgi:hypothetical protein